LVKNVDKRSQEPQLVKNDYNKSMKIRIDWALILILTSLVASQLAAPAKGGGGHAGGRGAAPPSTAQKSPKKTSNTGGRRFGGRGGGRGGGYGGGYLGTNTQPNPQNSNVDAATQQADRRRANLNGEKTIKNYQWSDSPTPSNSSSESPSK
jgi:hypothetical protein